MPEDDELGRDMKRQLSSLLGVLQASGGSLLPTSADELLQSIVEAAARIFGAAAASIALVLEEEQALEFKVAYGSGDEVVVGQRIPLDAGIAGYVAMTGQPIAISDVRRDPRFEQDFAESTGYVPDSILAMPLVWEGRVIGVMEVLDKVDAPSFGMQDIELMGIFAQQAAIAIRQSQVHEALDAALLAGLSEIASGSGSLEIGELLEAMAAHPIVDPTMRELAQIGALLAGFSQAGEAERELCIQVLSAFRDYVRSQHFGA
jgi:GAF domain-containing protein